LGVATSAIGVSESVIGVYMDNDSTVEVEACAAYSNEWLYSARWACCIQ
jgi:hypothetical protein